MSRRTIMLSTVSATALFAAMPVPELVGWCGEIDSVWHEPIETQPGETL